MTSRKWNLLAALAVLGMGVALPFAPYPADPVPGDNSDMMFNGIMAALLGVFVFGCNAWRPPKSDGAFTPLIYALGALCIFVLIAAHVALWLM